VSDGLSRVVRVVPGDQNDMVWNGYGVSYSPAVHVVPGDANSGVWNGYGVSYSPTVRVSGSGAWDGHACTGACIVDTWTRTEGPLDWGTSDSGLVWNIWHDTYQDSWVAEVNGKIGILGLECDELVPGPIGDAYYSEVRAYLTPDPPREDDGDALPTSITDTLEFWIDVRLSNVSDRGRLEIGFGGDESNFYLLLWPAEDVVGVENGDYDPWGTQEMWPSGLDWSQTVHIHAKKEPDGDSMLCSANFWNGSTEPEGWMVYDHSVGNLDTLSYFTVHLAQAFNVGNTASTMQARFDCLVIREVCRCVDRFTRTVTDDWGGVFLNSGWHVYYSPSTDDRFSVDGEFGIIDTSWEEGDVGGSAIPVRATFNDGATYPGELLYRRRGMPISFTTLLTPGGIFYWQEGVVGVEGGWTGTWGGHMRFLVGDAREYGDSNEHSWGYQWPPSTEEGAADWWWVRLYIDQWGIYGRTWKDGTDEADATVSDYRPSDEWSGTERGRNEYWTSWEACRDPLADGAYDPLVLFLTAIVSDGLTGVSVEYDDVEVSGGLCA
jgi:hypothetical protein